jgi:2-keto-3-deoxy-L-rhamnonate aldolase RhmA
MKKNLLRELLKAGTPTLGTHVLSPWPGIVEVIGHSGAFNYIEYVGEYAPFSLEQMDNFGRTIELFPNMSSMMKVEEQARGFIATRAIDSGIQNVLFTDCRSAADAEECVRVVRSETPEAGGIHGCAMRRNVGYVLEGGSEAWTKAMNDTVIAIMIEKKGAIENLEEILSVKGIDMVQFGPADYSISVGSPGKSGSPEIKRVERDMIDLALKKGIAPRAEIVSFEQAKPYLELGVRHFCIGWDVRVMYNWCKQQAQGMQELLSQI